jgi:hypothetical protein
MSPAKHKPQLFKIASVEDVDVDQLRVLERINEKKCKVEEEIERFADKERRKLVEETVQSSKGRPDGYRAQALSTFHRKELAPAQRCLTQVEATIYHYQVVVSTYVTFRVEET